MASPRPSAVLRTALRYAAALFGVGALGGIAALVLSDGAHHLLPTALHPHVAALPLILIGLSYLCLLPGQKRQWRETAQGTLLSTAFILWGAEMLLTPSRWTTAMDIAVVTIFVVDLGTIVLGQLRQPGQGTV